MQSPVHVELANKVLAHIDDLLKWAFILNGASAGGLLTFLGHTIGQKQSFPQWTAFGSALLAFCIGLIIVVVAKFAVLVALHYFAQVHDPDKSASQEDIRIYLLVGDRGVICAIVAIALYVASCMSFVIGILFGRYAIFG